MDAPIRVPASADEDRFARFGLIGWWDQRELERAKVLVVGVGALGNEILKNLALLGVGRVFAADLDRVERSNLSRSVLFREEDCGTPKAVAAAKRARELYPGIKIQPFVGDIIHDVGLGLFRWADVILGGLDNREARVAINRAAARAGKVWIDGAIERLSGVARVFDPATGPCYECTMGDADWKVLQARRSCALLSRAEMEGGKVPTTPTTAAVIAGIQTQEAVKFLHGREVLTHQGFVFDGQYHQSYTVTYSRKDDCPTHDPLDEIAQLDVGVADARVGDMLERIRRDLGPAAVLELSQDLLRALECPGCGAIEERRMSLGKVGEKDGPCPACGALRFPRFQHAFSEADRDVWDRTLGELGVPPWEVVGGRVGEMSRYYEFSGDRDLVLGVLAEGKSP